MANNLLGEYSIDVSAEAQKTTIELTRPATAINVNNPTAVTVVVTLWSQQTPGATPKLSFAVQPYTAVLQPTGSWLYGEITTTGTDATYQVVQIFPLEGVLAAGSWPLYPAPQTISTAIQGTVATDIGVGFPRLKGGGTFYPRSGGTTAVTFAKTSQQVMVFNQGNDQVSVWGDEDGNTGSVPTDAINLPGGGNLGVPWATGHIYLATTGTQVPVQVQAWG